MKFFLLLFLLLQLTGPLYNLNKGPTNFTLATAHVYLGLQKVSGLLVFQLEPYYQLWREP